MTQAVFAAETPSGPGPPALGPRKLRQRLLELQDRLEQVALLLDTVQELLRFEHEVLATAGLEGLFQLLPSERRRDGGAFTRTQGVHADRRLEVVVLAPVDQHLP